MKCQGRVLSSVGTCSNDFVLWGACAGAGDRVRGPGDRSQMAGKPLAPTTCNPLPSAQDELSFWWRTAVGERDLLSSKSNSAMRNGFCKERLPCRTAWSSEAKEARSPGMKKKSGR